MTKSGGGTICISVPPAPNSGGTYPPSPPVIYAHGREGKARGGEKEAPALRWYGAT